jgi:hypothetical protein
VLRGSGEINKTAKEMKAMVEEKVKGSNFIQKMNGLIVNVHF